MQLPKKLTYTYIDGILSIPAKLFYEDWELISYNYYKILCHRKKLKRTKEGRGKGNTAYLSYYDLPDIYKSICIDKLGNPNEVKTRNDLENYIMPDGKAVTFFDEHRTPDGEPLSPKKKRQKVDSCIVLNAIKLLLEDKKMNFGKQKTKIWKNISEAVNQLNSERLQFRLPGNWRRLKNRYEEYLEKGYYTFIHKGEGNINSILITSEIGDFLLAKYSLPVKPKIPKVWEEYEKERQFHDNWGTLTEQAIHNWLMKPENERIWTIGRHGKEAWDRKYKYTLKRKKDNWFPNVYWAIDGTKLDWIHVWDSAQNKLGAQLKINVLFDVYSEKIIGYSLSFTENITDHFKAIKMGVKHAMCRPYLISSDRQSGHKSTKMQNLYSSIVAKEKGTHYMHRAYAHNNPAEQIFKRLQEQVINRFWFSDGQSITVRRDDNKCNFDFIKKNKHLIKTTYELEQAWEAAVYKWNNNKHPHSEKTRNEMYNDKMPMREPLEILDILDKMWISENKGSTYRAHGLNLLVSDKKYQYEVYDSEGNIDIEFRRKNIGKKFIVRYDPEYLDEYVQLWTMNNEAELVFVAHAQPKRAHEVVPALMKEGDKKQWQKDHEVRDIEYNRDVNDYKQLLERTGITPEKLIEDQEFYIKNKKDRPKEERSKLESVENAISRL